MSQGANGWFGYILSITSIYNSPENRSRYNEYEHVTSYYLINTSIPLKLIQSFLFFWLLQVRFAKIPDVMLTVWKSSEESFSINLRIIFVKSGLIWVYCNTMRSINHHTSDVAASDKLRIVQRQFVTSRWELLPKWLPRAWKPPAWSIPILLSFVLDKTFNTRDVVHRS